MTVKSKAIISIIFISIFIYFCWYAYIVQIDYVNEHEIPILKAQSDIKAKPDNPGGMEVLNKDKAIYKHMLGKNKIEGQVKMIESSEKPVLKESLEDLINKQLKNGSSSNKQHIGAASIEPKKLEQKTPESDKSSGRDPMEIKVPQAKVIAASNEKYTIRVAKFKDKKFFAKGIEIFQKKYPVLEKYGGELVEKNGDYFLHFSNINSKKEANELCRNILQNGGKCSVIAS